MAHGSLTRYGFLALPVAFAGFPLYVLAPDFYATQYGMSLGTLGIVLAFLRLFDAIQDPFIGRLSDRYRHVILRIMIPAAVILVAGVFGLFSLMPADPLVWFGLCMAVAVTAYSILSINLNTIGALQTDNPDTQTRIAAIREGFAIAGLVIAVSLPVLLSSALPESLVYDVFSMILAGFMIIGLMIFARWYRATPQTPTTSTPSGSLVSILRGMSSSSKRLLAVYLTSMVASGIPAVLIIFFVRDLLGTESLTGLFLLVYFMSGAAFIPVWKRLAARKGKYFSWFISMLLAVATFGFAFILGPGDTVGFALICIASGAALGADLIFPPALLADQIHDTQRTQDASSYYAFLTLASKASLSVATVIALPILDLFGFVPETDNDPSALFGLSLTYALIPCLLKIGAALLLRHLFLSQKDNHDEKNTDPSFNTRSRSHAKQLQSFD